ncbi:hypothetical protein GPECTOR_29g90 [Gonium pectorale]|uniref:Dienelactone hydrolase domain-containing protein n=1 Tax=Gonium pectorale TaxID=33097 RepID=A0A150GEQ9_GONPE|nr:hypothetical protein GPECTOR_29g90 [Gonium pectorale]|eukprot:KXZ48316.1 hypothetical protein GPECTOR_29g90 [Gonium pectorale]
MVRPILLALAIGVACFLAPGANAFGRSLLQECKKNGDRCSLYGPVGQCCDGLLCTMPLECTSKGARSECQPECRKQTLGSLVRVNYTSASGTNTPGWEGGNKKKAAVIVMQVRRVVSARRIPTAAEGRVEGWWGVNEAIKETALHIAEQGYRVFIPDLYRGRVALNSMEAVGLSSDLNWTRGVDDIVGAANYLRATGSKKVAIVGFCQGGGMAYCGAQYANVNAAIPFYGLPPNTSICNPLRIPKTVPVQAHYGGNDTSFPMSRVMPAINGMQAAGVNIQFNLYPGLPHAFMNGIIPAGRLQMAGGRSNFVYPNETLVTQAFAKMTNFLRLHIRY